MILVPNHARFFEIGEIVFTYNFEYICDVCYVKGSAVVLFSRKIAFCRVCVFGTFALTFIV